MSDKFSCCSIDSLLHWILREEAHGEVFGIPRGLFFTPDKGDPFRLQRYGRMLEAPLGVAAGPHTQMAQNIVSAWLTGARYLELKTVQTLDELEVTKPCIDMRDEGYNCEWSQELKLTQSFDQYLNAWILLHLLRDKLGRVRDDAPGFIFNMSVGYNLAGIRNANVQHFLDKMSGCAEEKAARLEALAPIYPRVRDLDIPDRISDNITISTMHGCPPDEVEQIGRYFIEERRLNTTIKLNPTLLGPERLRRILNDRLGYGVEAPDEAFGHDLDYDAGVALIRALTKSAARHKVAFNLKLTNTLETLNLAHRLPEGEKMLYMSGRALHAVSINLARRLQNTFDGQLDISFAGGVDCFNFPQVLACGLKPVTVCSDILKPGGYGRLGQYLEELAREMRAAGAATLEQFSCARGGGSDPVKAALAFLNIYADAVVEDKRYRRTAFPYEGIKIPRDLPVFDCVKAPCVATCPAGQDIPGYMYHTARADDAAALETILATNPFPNVQGKVCDHLCQYKCTRMNYDNPLLIREIKRFVAGRRPGPAPPRPAPAKGLKVAVIGAGPSGLACAYFLARSGFAAEVFETKARAGGMAADGIPVFRLDEASLQTDIQAIIDLGVKVHYNSTVDGDRFVALQAEFDFIYVAVGAQKGVRLGIPGEDAPGVFDQLEFLRAVRRGQAPALGRKVIVVGGGNSAMDAARTAKRLVGREGRVSILYRRTRSEMPADAEEIQAALDEGIELIELTAPECLLVEDGRVAANVCFKMTLGEKDESGRPHPMKLEGSEFEIQADSVISAIGQRVELDFFPGGELHIDPSTLETRLPGVLAGGDAVRGAATLIKAIGDGQRAAITICRKAGFDLDLSGPDKGRKADPEQLKIAQARRIYGAAAPGTRPDQRTGFDLATRSLDEKTARHEAGRCLQCDLLCNICTTVCPNRANIAFATAPVSYNTYAARLDNGRVVIEKTGEQHIRQPWQIINLGDFCNECGNCATFCPTRDAPYQVKPKFYLDARSLDSEVRGYAFFRGALLARTDSRRERLEPKGDTLVYRTDQAEAQLNAASFKVERVRFTDSAATAVDLAHGPRLAVLWTRLKNSHLFNQG